MAVLGPFEPAPLIAAAVSGGGDSLALMHLADRWARARGGRVLAFTVDHGLRDGSAAEAAQVARWAAASEIEHRTLRWLGPKPTTRLMEKARAARYALLEEACEAAGALHLLIAHHAADQTETITLRAAAKSGPHGLAGMAKQRFTCAVRVLRPLLDFPKARLLATCKAFDQPWLDDPSNADPRFARARLRVAKSSASFSAADRFAQTRSEEESLAGELAARFVHFDPLGFAVVDRMLWESTSETTAAQVLSRAVHTIGAASHGLSPLLRTEAEHWARTGQWRGKRVPRITLGRAVLSLSQDFVSIAREARHLPPPIELAPGVSALWDRRFMATVDAPGWTLGALGMAGWSALHAEKQVRAVPAEARASLPVLRAPDGRMVFPFSARMVSEPTETAEIREFRWVGGGPAFAAAFTVVWAQRRIMF